MLEVIFIALILLFLILIIPYMFRKINHSHAPVTTQTIHDPYYIPQTDFPFWNTQLGSKRNMSYDLRGDASIPYIMWTPFNMPSRIPIRNKPLYLVS